MAMVTLTPSTLAEPDASSEGARTLWQTANQDLLHAGVFKTNSDLATALLPAGHLFDKTVQISPIDSVKRHSTGRDGILVESIYAPLGSKMQIYYHGPAHLLVLYEDGARREGET